MDFSSSILSQTQGSNQDLNDLIVSLTGGAGGNTMANPQLNALLTGMQQQSGAYNAGAKPMTPEEEQEYQAMHEISTRLAHEIQQQAVTAKLEQDVMSEQMVAASLYDNSSANTNSPKTTGHAGADRVNANTDKFGVTASVDASGRVTLTNLDSSGTPTPQSQTYPGQKPPVTVGSTERTTSVALNDTLARLSKSSNLQEAQSLASNARMGIVEEASRIREEVLKQESSRLGVPSLIERVAAAEKIDQRTPGYKVGMGDSANTKALRDQLFRAEDQARQNTETALQRNVSFARVTLADKQLSQEMARLERANQVDENRTAAANLRADEREARKQEAAATDFAALDPAQKEYVTRLNPGLTDPAEVVKYFDKQRTTSTEFKELINTPANRLPALAITNTKARTVAAQREAEITGRPIAQIENEIAAMAPMSRGEAAIKNWAKIKAAQLPGDRKKNEAEQVQLYQAASVGNTDAARAMKREMEQDIALTNAMMAKEARFAEDLTYWNMRELEPFIAQAIKTSGKADLPSVLTAYVGDKTGADALAAFAQLKDMAKAVGARERKSMFGGVNTAQLEALIDAEASKRLVLSNWFAEKVAAVGGVVNGFMSKPIESTPAFAPFLLMDALRGKENK